MTVWIEGKRGYKKRNVLRMNYCLIYFLVGDAWKCRPAMDLLLCVSGWRRIGLWFLW